MTDRFLRFTANRLNTQNISEMFGRSRKEDDTLSEGPFSQGSVKPTQKMKDEMDRISSTMHGVDEKGSFTQKKVNGKLGPKVYAESVVNEMFGKKKQTVSGEQHLQNLSTDAHKISGEAGWSSDDAWHRKPIESQINPRANREHVKNITAGLYHPEAKNSDAEDVRSNHQVAQEHHEIAGAAHSAAGQEALKQGNHDLAKEHFEHAKQHAVHAKAHQDEYERVNGTHYTW